MWLFLLGFYVASSIFTFWFVMFFVMLGGRDRDLWKPFVYAFGWPIALWWILSGKL